MAEFQDFEKKRRLKQLAAGVIFMAFLLGGWFYPLTGYFIPLCMLLGMGIGLFRGRKWCDWYCPQGSFYDYLMKPICSKKAIPCLFKNMYFRLAVLVVLMAVMTFNLIKRWPEPNGIGMFFVMMLTTTTILGIVLALIFHQRSWCCIYPIGTAIHLTGRNKKPLRINSELCIDCKLCEKVCPI